MNKMRKRVIVCRFVTRDMHRCRLNNHLWITYIGIFIKKENYTSKFNLKLLIHKIFNISKIQKRINLQDKLNKLNNNGKEKTKVQNIK